MLAVTIICKNEEKNIRECLESIKWADEIIVVDSYSTDGTLEIVKKYTDKVFQKEWEGYAKQRDFALSKVTQKWVFPLDADERCSAELKEEILSVINSEDYKAGYRIPRKSFFLGKWIKHCGWYPGFQTRLFLKAKAKVADRLVHEGYEIEGEMGFLKSDILHYTVRDITNYMERVNGYSTLQAIEKSHKKKVKLYDILLRPMATFIQSFIFKKGFLDGIYGLLVTHFDVITNMLTYMKAWQMQNKKENKRL